MKRIVFVLAMTAAFTAVLSANTILINVTLDGAQAGTASPGTGSAQLTIDDVANTLLVDMSFSGLTTPTTNAHIHCCAPPGSSAGVIIPFMPPFVIGTTSGTFNNTFNLTAALIAQVESGGSYINIHTTAFPAGEIRGQIPAPEPTTLSLIGGALAVLAARYRLRRRGSKA